MIVVSLLCPRCSNYFRVPVELDEDGDAYPVIPQHKPCNESTNLQESKLESSLS